MSQSPASNSLLPLRDPTWGSKLTSFFRDIKISHTVFALPFALLSAFLAAGGVPPLGILGLILVCMVTARSLAMAVNRLLDADLDSQNPRTARRAIPAGLLSRRFYLGISLLCAAVFCFATYGFLWAYHNPWPLRLSLPLLAFLCAYSLLKRFTRLCHYYLGLALGLAPICAWIAVRGSLATPPLWMALAVLCWTAGFDIIYACQDYQSDLATGVFSIPAKVGVASALWISRLTHAVCVAALLGLAWSTPLLGNLYLLGVAITAALLVVEHSLVSADDLSRANTAFFTLNGIISLLLGSLGIVSVLVRR